MEYEAVIGLEVHAQLLTDSKVFCGCSTQFGLPPNTNTCPVCLGLPGVLPVLNRKVLEFTLKMALATGCKIAPSSRFARKNYFYPDLPKGYQISQYELPIATGGSVEIRLNGKKKRIGLTRIHMEEDAGKLIHGENLDDPNSSYVDFNRSGVPLIEIVSEPDLRSPEEAQEFLQELRKILVYLEICDGNMEEGSLRCDANISVNPVGSEKFGTKVELKNMNSFRFVRRALEYEIERQIKLLTGGREVIQETRLWDPSQGVTTSMRQKEEAHDYRYFPEPDLVPLEVDEEWVERIRATLPESPQAKLERFMESYGLPEYDARILTSTRALADYFEECTGLYPQPKTVSNWVMGELLRVLKERKLELEECRVTARHLASLLKMVESGEITGTIAKAVFEEMAATGEMPEEVVEKKGLRPITDAAELSAIVEKVLAENPDPVKKYRAGKEKLLGFLVGQVMKATGGKANPGELQRMLREKLSSKER